MQKHYKILVSFVKKKNNGFIYVASVNPRFLTAAIHSAMSLREYYPKANITLFTEDGWIEPQLSDTFDTVIGGMPHNARAKLYALSRSPYKLTLYLDADTEIMSSEIATVFDHAPRKTGIVLTRIRPYNGKISKFPGGNLTDHCGLFLYDNSNWTISFMKQWWLLYQKQKSGEWKWDTKLYPEELRTWDQWTYWWLQNKTDWAIPVTYFPDDARWNFINGYRDNETDKEIIIYHHTIRRQYHGSITTAF